MSPITFMGDSREEAADEAAEVERGETKMPKPRATASDQSAASVPRTAITGRYWTKEQERKYKALSERAKSPRKDLRLGPSAPECLPPGLTCLLNRQVGRHISRRLTP